MSCPADHNPVFRTARIAPRWTRRLRAEKEEQAQLAEAAEEEPQPVEKFAAVTRSPCSLGRAIWLLGRRGVEMSLPEGGVRSFSLPLDVRSGSRAVRNPRTAGEVFVLENGSSRMWRLQLDAGRVAASELTAASQASRFRSSLGSRMVCCEGGASLVVTGTPGPGAHALWRFDVDARIWTRLPDAPHAILSSAATNDGDDALTIAGGWSKQRSCHGHVQNFRFSSRTWSVASSQPMPWRRPGAGCFVSGKFFVALGWMECDGRVGSDHFRLLKRNGSAQRARTSSSRLCDLGAGGSEALSEVDAMPLSDSFEHSGELHLVGGRLVCIGRDHIQAYDLERATWKSWRPPGELSDDQSNSWVKHCGSWALAWIE